MRGLHCQDDFLGRQENGEKLEMGRSGLMADISQSEGTLRELKHLQLLGAPKERGFRVGLLDLY